MPLSGVLEQLFNYWKSLPRERDALLPARETLLPTDLRDMMPRLSLLKRQQRYQVHVSMIRTASNESWRSPFIGMNAFDLTAPSMRENSAKLYDAILNQPSGALMTEDILGKNGKRRCVHSLYLPMEDENGKASYIVGCSVYRRKPCYENTNDRLIPSHNHVIGVDFFDLGAGLPEVEFEMIEPTHEPALSFQWWERFLPDWRKPKPDFRGHRGTPDGSQPRSASWLARGTVGTRAALTPKH